MELDAKQPDIDFILKAIQEAAAENITPEQILSPEERLLYDMYQLEEIMDVSHYDNLVNVLDSSTVARLAQDCVNLVKWDEQTRKDWSDRESRGIRSMGVSDRINGEPAFIGASEVTHPLLMEAIVEFHARAMAELWPPEGPVKCVVIGEKDEYRTAQAERVEDYMNFQYTEDMPGGFEETDSLLFRLPLSGSCFKKVYYDPLLKKICSRLIEPSDFIVPFSATDLESAPRFTHRYRESHNTVMKKIAKGYYTKGKSFSSITNELMDYPEVKEEIDATEGRERVSNEHDSRHTILEVSIDLDLKGFEDEVNGVLTEIALPYLVWIDRDNLEVLRVQRNWNPDDEDKQRIIDVSHYRFMPGLGFYGYGLFHMAGGLSDASTGALRALLDSAAFANMQGGFRTRDSRVKGGDTPLRPGEWREVDISAEELSKAFFRVPYEEPSITLFNLLQYLDERGAKFIGTTDIMTGDANPNAPVGTTLAMIEQGTKKISAIHRRLHIALKNEFRILARLNSEHIPEQGYPYNSKSGSNMIMSADFDERVDVIPVSDPSIISNTQRIIQAQSVLNLAEKYPDKIDVELALENMLKAMRVSNYDELLKIDPAIQQAQAKIQQLQMQLQEAQIAKLSAEKDKVDAEKTESVMRSIFASMQSAEKAAMNPVIATMGDVIYASGGGKDYNGPTLTSANVQPMQQTMPDKKTEFVQNTSPGFPALPEQVKPAMPVTPGQTNIVSPETGQNQGIETIAND